MVITYVQSGVTAAGRENAVRVRPSARRLQPTNRQFASLGRSVGRPSPHRSFIAGAKKLGMIRGEVKPKENASRTIAVQNGTDYFNLIAISFAP